MQGHDPRSYDSSMGTVYNNESRQKALEEQASLFPNGALALLNSVEILDDLSVIPAEAKALFSQLWFREIGYYKFQGLLEEMQIKVDTARQIRTGM